MPSTIKSLDKSNQYRYKDNATMKLLKKGRLSVGWDGSIVPISNHYVWVAGRPGDTDLIRANLKDIYGMVVIRSRDFLKTV